MAGILLQQNFERDSLFNLSHLTLQPSITVADEVDGIDYRCEAARLKSFVNWPCPFVSPNSLAAAGFYYTGEGDKVRCFECQVEICNWEEGDKPMVDHQRWSGRCRFIRKIPCGNVPLGVDPSTVPAPSPRGRDVCGSYGIEHRPTAIPDKQTFSADPMYPDYTCYDTRLQTFQTWPKSMGQKKEQLVDAGFFYTGQGDRTLCYHCGGGLKDWEPEDDPWMEHAKWFSKCDYLLMVKGPEYVNTITSQSETPPSKEETKQTSLPSTSEKVEQPAVAKPATKDENSPGNSEAIDDPIICKICYNGKLGAVFVPCGHLVACVQCAANLTTCPLCRKHVTMVVRSFFS